MAIQVTCPSCLKRFTVSDKFAGRTGPCPQCQKPIKIPEKSDEVVIHAPKSDHPTDAAGRSILKPIRRKEVQLSAPVILAGVVSSLVVVAIAFGLGLSGQQPHTAVLAVCSVLLALPLVFAGYWFLHDDELEGFSGQQLWIRIGVVTAAFAALWAMYAYVPQYLSGYSSMAEFTGIDMFIFITLMIVFGTLASVAALELEIAQGLMLYMLYFTATFLLAWISGTQLGGPLGNVDTQPTAPPATAPATPDAPAQPDTAPSPELKPGKEVPKLLQ